MGDVTILEEETSEELEKDSFFGDELPDDITEEDLAPPVEELTTEDAENLNSNDDVDEDEDGSFLKINLGETGGTVYDETELDREEEAEISQNLTTARDSKGNIIHEDLDILFESFKELHRRWAIGGRIDPSDMWQGRKNMTEIRDKFDFCHIIYRRCLLRMYHSLKVRPRKLEIRKEVREEFIKRGLWITHPLTRDPKKMKVLEPELYEEYRKNLERYSVEVSRRIRAEPWLLNKDPEYLNICRVIHRYRIRKRYNLSEFYPILHAFQEGVLHAKISKEESRKLFKIGMYLLFYTLTKKRRRALARELGFKYATCYSIKRKDGKGENRIWYNLSFRLDKEDFPAYLYEKIKGFIPRYTKKGTKKYFDREGDIIFDLMELYFEHKREGKL